MKPRIEIGQRIKAGMVAEGSFQDKIFSGVNISFNDKVDIGRNFQLVCQALYELNFFLPEETCKQVFVKVFRKRGCSSISVRRIAAERH
jgi:hypothetical protein